MSRVLRWGIAAAIVLIVGAEIRSEIAYTARWQTEHPVPSLSSEGPLIDGSYGECVSMSGSQSIVCVGGTGYVPGEVVTISGGDINTRPK